MVEWPEMAETKTTEIEMAKIGMIETRRDGRDRDNRDWDGRDKTVKTGMVEMKQSRPG